MSAKGAWPVVQACALLAERHYLPARSHTTTSDLLSAIDAWDAADHHVKQAARDIRRTIDRSFMASVAAMNEADFRRAILAGYPDRVARRRDAASARVKLASGAGAVLGRESGVVDGEFLVAIDVQAGETSAAVVRRSEGRSDLATRRLGRR